MIHGATKTHQLLLTQVIMVPLHLTLKVLKPGWMKIQTIFLHSLSLTTVIPLSHLLQVPLAQPLHLLLPMFLLIHLQLPLLQKIQLLIIPPEPFPTPPKLKLVEQVMSECSGTDILSLRRLTTALAREAIFGKKEMSKKSLSGRGGLEELEKAKVNYIKALVHSRVPKQSMVDFEKSLKECRGSLSKSCQTIRDTQTKKNHSCEHNIIIIAIQNWLINFLQPLNWLTP